MGAGKFFGGRNTFWGTEQRQSGYKAGDMVPRGGLPSVDLRSLAVFRMGLGGILVADALLRSRDFSLMLTPDGMFPLESLSRLHLEPGIWSLAFLIDASWWSALILGLEAAAGLALAVGWHTPLATAIGWVTIVSVIRRTSPATNAGDLWLAALLFWSLFLPLGSRLSADRRWASGPGECRAPALVLQIAGVYLAAGLSKCNGFWLSGDAVRYALSLHDHGTLLGAAVAEMPGLCRGLTWAVLGLELAGPALLLAGGRLRSCAALAFAIFHGSVWLLMSVGLFSAVGLVACSAFIPPSVWTGLAGRRKSPRRRVPGANTVGFSGASAPDMSSGTWGRLFFLFHGPPGRCSCGPQASPAAGGDASARTAFSLLAGRVTALGAWALGVVAIAAWLHGVGFWPSFPKDGEGSGPRPLPWPIAAVVNAACLPQDWAMFGDVHRQRQWVYSVGRLADGRELDVLRGGRGLERRLPQGGSLSLPHHRWHKLLWVLHQPRMQTLGGPVASALARSWNARHPPDEQLVSLEIRLARLPDDDPEATLHELLVGSWPTRNSRGRGGLDRLLEDVETAPGEPP